jgi:MFS family permease
MVILIVGLQTPDLAAVIIGGMLSGVGQGLSFRGAMALVNAETPPEHRGAITSVFFIVLYIAISIPVVAVGIAAQLSSVKSAGTVCAGVVAAMAVVAAAILRRPRRDRPV